MTAPTSSNGHAAPTAHNGAAARSTDQTEREAYQQAAQAQADAIAALLGAAAVVRQRAQGDGQRDEALRRIARSLEQAANQLNSRPVGHVDDPAAVPGVPWRTLAVGLLLGLLLGRRRRG